MRSLHRNGLHAFGERDCAKIERFRTGPRQKGVELAETACTVLTRASEKGAGKHVDNAPGRMQTGADALGDCTWMRVGAPSVCFAQLQCFDLPPDPPNLDPNCKQQRACRG